MFACLHTMEGSSIPLRLKLITALVFCIGMFACGLTVGALGTLLIELAVRTGLSVGAAGSSITGFGIGQLIAAFASGALVDRCPGHPQLVVASLANAIGCAMLPSVRSLLSLLVATGCFGISMGILDTAGNVMVFWLWGEDAPPPASVACARRWNRRSLTPGILHTQVARGLPSCRAHTHASAWARSARRFSSRRVVLSLSMKTRWGACQPPSRPQLWMRCLNGHWFSMGTPSCSCYWLRSPWYCHRRATSTIRCMGIASASPPEQHARIGCHPRPPVRYTGAECHEPGARNRVDERRRVAWRRAAAV